MNSIIARDCDEKALPLNSLLLKTTSLQYLQLTNMPRLLFILVITLAAMTPAEGQQQPAIKLGILDFGISPQGKLVAENVRSQFRSSSAVQLVDRDLSAAAARGVGYSGSLNMSLSDARDLGSALDAEFFIIGDAQTLRRSSSAHPVYYESYSSVLLISSRTGRLVLWDRLVAEADTAKDAEQKLNKTLVDDRPVDRYMDALKRAQREEANQRAIVVDQSAPLIEDAPEDEKIAATQGLRLPRPYRRLRPTYPESAAKADAEGTVDVLVDVGADGEIQQVQVARWAGFGLDETTVATVRQLHFFPAMRNGKPIPMRVLLRYNFRKPSQ
jgi:TonB family protein